MAVFDNIKETISNAAKTAVNKSNELVEATKLKFAISDAEGEIKKLYEKMGKGIYDSFKSGEEPSEDLKDTCAQIDKLYESLDELKAKLREYKNVKLCANCGAEMDADSAFCSKCGEKADE